MLHWSCQHALPCVTLVLSSAPMASSSMAVTHGPLNCHSILTSHRALVGLLAFTAMPDAPIRCGSILVLPVQNEEEVTEKTEVVSKPIRKPKQPGVSVETLHLLSNQRNANQQITKNCTAVSSSRLQPLSGIMGTSCSISLLAFYFQNQILVALDPSPSRLQSSKCSTWFGKKCLRVAGAWSLNQHLQNIKKKPGAKSPP